MNKKLKYNDKPRFKLISEYEDAAKKAYQITAINTVKLVGLKMLDMIPKGN